MTSPAPGGSRRALVVRGGWDGHQPVAATQLFLPFLRDAGFDVTVHDVVDGQGPLPYADAELMAGLDLIVQCVTMSSATAEQVTGLRDAVAAGTGLAGWHGGIADSYRASADYQQLVGGLFACHPGVQAHLARGVEEDNFLPHRYTITDPDHPITSGLDDFDLVTEQYWVLSDDYVDVLATTSVAARSFDPWHRPITSPAVWTRRWGQGRVVVSTPGHRVDVLEHPTVRTIVERGLLWASR